MTAVYSGTPTSWNNNTKKKTITKNHFAKGRNPHRGTSWKLVRNPGCDLRTSLQLVSN